MISAIVLLAAGAFACALDASAAAGDADPSFGGAGYVRYAAPKIVPGLTGALLALDDGSVIVGAGADTDVFVRRYRSDGSLDESFGSNGTTPVPGLTGGGRTSPSLHLLRDTAGRILIEQAGKVRRLAAILRLLLSESPPSLARPRCKIRVAAGRPFAMTGTAFVSVHIHAGPLAQLVRAEDS